MTVSARARVLVIGGTRGTGLLIANRLADRGYRVRALARDPAGVPTMEVP